MTNKIKILLLLLFACNIVTAQQTVLLGTIGGSTKVVFAKQGELWSIKLQNSFLSSSISNQPFTVEFFRREQTPLKVGTGYSSVKSDGNRVIAYAVLHLDNTSVTAKDLWTIHDNELNLQRTVIVKTDTSNSTIASGFTSEIFFTNKKKMNRDSIQYFVPGLIYGNEKYLTEVAIGGAKHNKFIQIREDRMPVPMFGIYCKDGSSVTVLNSQPNGATTLADAADTAVTDMTDSGFQFGALGCNEINNQVSYGYVFPGTEGEVTYKGNTYPGGQLHQWRRRYHPVISNFSQQYQVSFKVSNENSFLSFYTKTWEWAWSVLKPRVNYHNIEEVKKYSLGVLGSQVETINGRTGITNLTNSVFYEKQYSDRKTVMGFCGKAIETAWFLIKGGDEAGGTEGRKYYKQGIAIINSFVEILKLNPPQGEGFVLDDGKIALAIPHEKKIFLRSFGDDLKVLCRVYEYEKKAGRIHEEWLQWAKTFADWLMQFELPDGGFPRTWDPGTGKALDISPQSSYTVIPFLINLSILTGDKKYHEAAVKAGNFCWEYSQKSGKFIGGTIDNPDIIDKEAGTLSLEAYLSIYKATKNKVWLLRAQAAADYSATWIYLWDVPISKQDTSQVIHWKAKVPTTGFQLIATGHSLVDAYMTFDVDEFAELYQITKKKKYYDIAKILLHNTKSMMSLPGHPYDLKDFGWQQEHWSFAPLKGYGLHRFWLPWVTTSHLNGIYGLLDLDKALYKKLCSKE